jgi:N-acyl-D-aspartate/D-glutamate deacylase
VREQKWLSLMDAIRKMSLMPARRLESRAPAMRQKGRIQIGADADLAIFDSVRVIDNATYEAPARYSEGMRYVLVGGVEVVNEGRLVEGATPGKPIRAPAAAQ